MVDVGVLRIRGDIAEIVVTGVEVRAGLLGTKVGMGPNEIPNLAVEIAVRFGAIVRVTGDAQSPVPILLEMLTATLSQPAESFRPQTVH